MPKSACYAACMDKPSVVSFVLLRRMNPVPGGSSIAAFSPVAVADTAEQVARFAAKEFLPTMRRILAAPDLTRKYITGYIVPSAIMEPLQREQFEVAFNAFNAWAAKASVPITVYEIRSVPRV